MPALRPIARSSRFVPSRPFAALVASVAVAAAACAGGVASPSVAPSVAAPASASVAASPSVASSGSTKGYGSESPSPSVEASTAESESPSSGGGGDAVTILNFSFGPDSITVAKGSTVTWTNQDDVGHTVTFDKGDDTSGTLNQGATYKEKFKTAGTFTYHCRIHPSMTGTVIVTG
ncbi:MAG TPA: cupredoxin family copper-binding protein [Candidatus Limnocylindrales bacterium]